MNSEETMMKWRKERVSNPDELPEPIPSVIDEDRRARRLVEQINQLAEYGKDDSENE